MFPSFYVGVYLFYKQFVHLFQRSENWFFSIRKKSLGMSPFGLQLETRYGTILQSNQSKRICFRRSSYVVPLLNYGETIGGYGVKIEHAGGFGPN
jgi:hypothetical protein